MWKRIRVWCRRYTVRAEYRTSDWVVSDRIGRAIDGRQFELSHRLINEAAEYWGEDDPEIIRANTLMDFLERDK